MEQALSWWIIPVTAVLIRRYLHAKKARPITAATVHLHKLNYQMQTGVGTQKFARGTYQGSHTTEV